MRYHFLTAYRNEAAIIETFLDEFHAMARNAGIAAQSTLVLVDDLSLDATRTIIERYGERPDAIPIEIIPAPTNLGNQGAMFHGLTHLGVAADDVLVTFDCDGEDDVREIPAVLELGRRNPGKLVLIERGRRAESLAFKLFFAVYKAVFRFLTQKAVVPNNFMLIPGALVPAMQRSPVVTVHFAYGVLKLNAPFIAITRDRRTRYGGRTSQNLFMLVSHGLVGLMVFYEVVVAKLFMLLFLSGGIAAAVVVAGAVAPAARQQLLWLGLGIGGGALLLLGLLVASALAFVFKLSIYALISSADERRAGSRPPPGAAVSAPRGAPPGRPDTAAR
ncbi:MAG TPA: glycosyltransferase [Anaeromyxobacteraceae bacterium]|nr:glycosyltransferase [Anaeromyxobacteraceae bacterium]